jgi:hypothetical protein
MGVGLVFEADLRTEEHPSHWVLQGVCLVLNVDYWINIYYNKIKKNKFNDLFTQNLSMLLHYIQGII